MSRRLDIAIVVHGRFHAFGLANALFRMGHRVTLLTNYPPSLADGDIPRGVKVEVFWSHFIRSRAARYPKLWAAFDSTKNYLESFGRWAASRLRHRRWDLIYSWSSVSKELLESANVNARMKVVVRGSTHILFQDRILAAEAERTGNAIERPDQDTIQRELFEYSHADAVVVLSSFCRETFLEQGLAAERVVTMLPGTNEERFRSDSLIKVRRWLRMLNGERLRVITIGTFSLRKGAAQYCEIIRQLSRSRFEFRFVGGVAQDAANLAKELQGKVFWVPRLRQPRLPAHMAWGDVYLSVTLEEGFPQTALQAFVAGLPIVTTASGGAKDLQAMGASCLCIPAGDAKETALLLDDTYRNRTQLVRECMRTNPQVGSWENAATSLLSSLGLNS